MVRACYDYGQPVIRDTKRHKAVQAAHNVIQRLRCFPISPLRYKTASTPAHTKKIKMLSTIFSQSMPSRENRR